MKNLKEKYLFELKDILGDDIVLKELSDDELVKELIGSYVPLLEKKGDIDELEEQIRELEREVASLESENASLVERCNGMTDEILELDDKITDLEFEIENFNSGTP
jgi:chromosome segregation ATPase